MTLRHIAGGTIFRGKKGRLYGCCAACGSIVRLDKPINGSLHICTDGRSDG